MDGDDGLGASLSTTFKVVSSEFGWNMLAEFFPLLIISLSSIMSDCDFSGFVMFKMAFCVLMATWIKFNKYQLTHQKARSFYNGIHSYFTTWNALYFSDKSYLVIFASYKSNVRSRISQIVDDLFKSNLRIVNRQYGSLVKKLFTEEKSKRCNHDVINLFSLWNWFDLSSRCHLHKHFTSCFLYKCDK